MANERCANCRGSKTRQFRQYPGKAMEKERCREEERVGEETRARVRDIADTHLRSRAVISSTHITRPREQMLSSVEPEPLPPFPVVASTRGGKKRGRGTSRDFSKCPAGTRQPGLPPPVSFRPANRHAFCCHSACSVSLDSTTNFARDRFNS